MKEYENEQFKVEENQKFDEYQVFKAEDFKSLELFKAQMEDYKVKEIQKQSFVEGSEHFESNDKKQQKDNKVFDKLKLPPVLNEYSIRKLCENCNFSCFKAKSELGYNPRSLEESLKDTVEWMRNNEIVEKERKAKEEAYNRLMRDFEELDEEQKKLEKKYNRRIEEIEEKAKREYEKIK